MKTAPAREFQVKGKVEEKTGWPEQNESQIGGEEKWQSCWCCRDQQRACRMAPASAIKPEHTGPAEKQRVVSVPQREQLASTPEPPFPKGKKQSRLSRVPDREGGVSQGGREPHLGETEEDQSESMERKGWIPR